MRFTCSLAIIAALVGGLLAAPAIAGSSPTICEFSSALDRALKLRFQSANYVAEDATCRFASPQGCRFASSVSPSSKITIAIKAMGAFRCGEDMRCVLSVVQSCVQGGAACGELMYDPEVAYDVDAVVERNSAGDWRIVSWFRTAASHVDARLTQPDELCG